MFGWDFWTTFYAEIFWFGGEAKMGLGFYLLRAFNFPKIERILWQFFRVELAMIVKIDTKIYVGLGK